MAKYLDKSREKWEDLVDQWHNDSSVTCSLQEYLELDDIEYLKNVKYLAKKEKKYVRNDRKSY